MPLLMKLPWEAVMRFHPDTATRTLLLPPQVFEEEYFDTKRTEKGGDDKVITTVRALRKVALCEHLCARGDAKDFAKFDPIINRLALFFGMPRSDPRAAAEIAAVEEKGDD
jgi:hypothetical protein